MSGMGRGEFVALLGGALSVRPARAQQAPMPIVGFVRITTPKDSVRRLYNAKVICVSTSAVSVHSEESDTPRRRTPLRIGNWAASNSALIDAKVEQSEIGAAYDRLRVMMWKSANLTLIVTVRPRTPVVWQ